MAKKGFLNQFGFGVSRDIDDDDNDTGVVFRITVESDDEGDFEGELSDLMEEAIVESGMSAEEFVERYHIAKIVFRLNSDYVAQLEEEIEEKQDEDYDEDEDGEDYDEDDED